MPPKAKGRGMTFQNVEVDLLLTLLEDAKPTGQEQWERLTNEFNRRVGTRPREMESLRTKFKSLRNKPKPTGDPDCPEEVRRAKRIQRDIENQMGVEDWDDDGDDNDGDDNDGDDNDGENVGDDNHGDDEGQNNQAPPRHIPLPLALTLPATPRPVTTVVGRRPPAKSNNRNAGVLRTGMTSDELRAQAMLRGRTPSPTTQSSGPSSSRRTVDGMLNEMIKPAQSNEPSMQQLMMWQQENDTKKEEREREREEKRDERQAAQAREDRQAVQAREDRDRQHAVEQERIRREELRYREERDERREEGNRNMMMLMMRGYKRDDDKQDNDKL
jgi:flagellar biosynthesis GTPase FlhF